MAWSSLSVAAPVIAVLVLILVAPSAMGQTGSVDSFTVDATFSIPSDLDTAKQELFLISGALSYQADLRGILVAAGDQGSVFQVGRIEVYDANDAEAFARQQPVLGADHASLIPDLDASYAWSFPRAAADIVASHTVGILVDVESQMEDLGPLVPKREGGPLPHLVADGRGAQWHLTADIGRGVFLPLDGGFRVQNNVVDRAFTGRDWIVLFSISTDARLDAIGLAVPTSRDMSIGFTRAADAAFTERFTTTRVNEFITKGFELADLAASLSGPPQYTPPTCIEDPVSCLPPIGGQSSMRPAYDGLVPNIPLLAPGRGMNEPTQPSFLDQVRAAQAKGAVDGSQHVRAAQDSHAAGGSEQAPAPAFALPPGVVEGAGSSLNGAVVGNVIGRVSLGDETTETPELTIVRFDTLAVSGFETGEASMSGTSPFGYSGGDAYHNQSLLAFSYFIVPFVSIGLFAVAIILFIVARIVNRTPDEDDKGESLRLYARIARIGLWVLALVLFDRELFHVFGESVLGTLGFWGGAGFSWKGFGVILLIESLVWGYASFLFGLPVKIAGKSVLRMSHVSKRLAGFPAGLAALVAFLFGVGLIRPVLGVVLASVDAAL